MIIDKRDMKLSLCGPNYFPQMYYMLLAQFNHIWWVSYFYVKNNYCYITINTIIINII